MDEVIDKFGCGLGQTAGGINLFLSVLVGISAYLGHSFSGKFDYMLFSSVVFPTIIGMYFGSKFVRIANQDQMKDNRDTMKQCFVASI